MSDSLKDKLEAAAAERRKMDQQAMENQVKYHETVLREYTRMVTALYEQVKRLLGNADGMEISTVPIRQRLTYHAASSNAGSRQIDIGEVEVLEWTVDFFGKRIMFRPAGIGFIGALAKIHVSTTGRNPFPKEGIFVIQSRKEPLDFKLVILDDRAKAIDLTDEILQARLEAVLL